MCGICGYTGRLRPGALEAMANALRHRGPDAEGFDTASSAGTEVHLGHRRLSILDLAQGAQPMRTQDARLSVVFNGEIYNYPELRRHLEARSHRFLTDHSDTETLLHGWHEWGTDLPEHLNGMWAFALHDREKNTLFLSRDRFGKKPLYFTRQNGVFAFASELTALRKHPDLRFSLDPQSVRKYFAYAFIPAPRTIFQEVQKLPPGHNLLLDLNTGNFRIWRYWEYRIEPFEKIPANPEEEWGEQLRELLSGAVKRRLLSDVPLGVLLSGGIDSSAVAALAARHAPNLKTFSIGFREDSFDESPYAQQVATHIGSQHFLSILDRDDARVHAPEVLGRLDEPMADDSLLPTWLVCREARKEVTVALGGDGGDELFAGYEPFKVWPWGRRFDIYLPHFIQAAVQKSVNLLPAAPGEYMPLSLKLKRFFRASGHGMKVWIPALMAPLGLSEIRDLLQEPAPLEEIYQEAMESWDRCASANPADRITQYYVDLYLPNEILTKGDRAGMMNSLEIRCPFLDLEVADFARKIPASYRLRGGISKYILKKALEPLLPHEILYRRKQGFSPPTGRWFQTGGLSFPDDSPLLGSRTFFTRAQQAHAASRTDHTRYLWSQYAIDLFMRQSRAQ